MAIQLRPQINFPAGWPLEIAGYLSDRARVGTGVHRDIPVAKMIGPVYNLRWLQRRHHGRFADALN